MTPFAKLLDAIPEVPTTAYRNAFYASPTINTRVHNLATGNIEMWDGSAWQTIFEGVTSGAGRVIFTGATAPNGTQVGSAGDVYVQQVSATVTLLWLKQSGTGTNTGWQALSATGTGSPQGAVAAPIGVPYAQTDGANGVVVYAKNSGTGNTGWRPLQTATGVYNVLDYGAKGDGTTDDTAAVQAALTAGKLGTVYFPTGTYKITSTLTVANPLCRLIGAGEFETTLQWSAAAAGTLLSFTTGGYVDIRDLHLNGYSGSGNYFRVSDVGISTAAVLSCTNAYFQGFANLIVWAGGFYHKFINCRFEMADVALPNWNANNLSFFGCRCVSINKWLTTSGGAGPVLFSGCAFERWCQTAISGVAGNRPTVTIVGCYFENYPLVAAGNGLATSFYSGGTIAGGIGEFTFLGNMVSTDGVRRILDNSGIATASIISKGNQVVYDPASSHSWMDFAYVYASLGAGDFSDACINTLTAAGSPTFTFAYSSSPSWTNPDAIRLVNPLTGYSYAGGSVQSADNGDAPATLTVGTSAPVQIWNTPLTTPRAVTLGGTNTNNGSSFIVVRTAAATGASALNVGAGPLAALGPGEWGVFSYNGAAWTLEARGILAQAAPLASPAFTGTPTAPTAAANTNTTQLATTAYVDRAPGSGGFTSAAPSGTTSATAVMMAAGAATITPTKTGRVLMIASGQVANSLIGDGATVDLRSGTGTAPVNGAAVTGTLRGIAQTFTTAAAAERDGFCLSAIVSGLTLGTAVWVDLSLLAITAGTASITGVCISLAEI